MLGSKKLDKAKGLIQLSYVALKYIILAKKMFF